MSADLVQTWYTVRQLATILGRTPKTVRRLLRPYRSQCALVREGKNPRRVLLVPHKVAVRIQWELLKGPPESGVVERNLGRAGWNEE